MTQAEISQLFKTDYQAFCRYIANKAGDYETSQDAEAAAARQRAERRIMLFEYGVSPNPHGGFDVCSMSCDG